MSSTWLIQKPHLSGPREQSEVQPSQTSLSLTCALASLCSWLFFLVLHTSLITQVCFGFLVVALLVRLLAGSDANSREQLRACR